MNLHLPDPPAAPPHREALNICHSLLVVARCSLFVASGPAGTRCSPRIRVIRLGSLPRARRGGLPRHTKNTQTRSMRSQELILQRDIIHFRNGAGT